MHFGKPALTPLQQLDRLIDCGLQVSDENRAMRLLEVTSYFRLIPYMRTFQLTTADGRRFQTGTGLKRIYCLYQFDSQLRQLTMAAIERIEVAVRAAITNHMAPTYGAHWYMDRGHFKTNYRHDRLINSLKTQLERERQKFSRERLQIENSRASEKSQERRIDHRKRDNYFRFYAETYTEPSLPPSWAMAEELSLGDISHLYRGLAHDRDRKQIARCFKLPQNVLGSWLHTLTFIRNICAHHSRLWNRELAVSPSWHRRLPSPDNNSGPAPPRRFFTVAAMLVYLGWKVSPDTNWLERLQALMIEHPDIPLEPMGFPDQWQEGLHKYQNDST